MEFRNYHRSSGVARGGLTTGIIGTALGGLNSLALMGAAAANNGCNNGCNNCNGNGSSFDSGLATGAVLSAAANNGGWNGWGNGWNNGGWGGFNTWGWNPWNNGCCSENQLVNRYEQTLQGRISELETQVQLRDANTYTDQKLLQLYQYIDGRMRSMEADSAAAQQSAAVQVQKTADSFQLVSERLDCLRQETFGAIAGERQARKDSDTILTNYMNATFYPKMVADVTTGSTTTAQTTYNPLPCCCGNGMMM